VRKHGHHHHHHDDEEEQVSETTPPEGTESTGTPAPPVEPDTGEGVETPPQPTQLPAEPTNPMYPGGQPETPGGRGLLDGVPTVRYNDGSGFQEALVLKEGDGKSLVLGVLGGQGLQLINGGEPVPERAESEYGPEGGGVTWTH
jgi:hypothetical protein